MNGCSAISRLPFAAQCSWIPDPRPSIKLQMFWVHLWTPSGWWALSLGIPQLQGSFPNDHHFPQLAAQPSRKFRVKTVNHKKWHHQLAMSGVQKPHPKSLKTCPWSCPCPTTGPRSELQREPTMFQRRSTRVHKFGPERGRLRAFIHTILADSLASGFLVGQVAHYDVIGPMNGDSLVITKYTKSIDMLIAPHHWYGVAIKCCHEMVYPKNAGFPPRSDPKKMVYGYHMVPLYMDTPTVSQI